ncbi:MAG: glycosyltransferase family 4 protein [Methanotrichaceae archaeon]|nr:glycosyltransferase family 4 protein [Methanotrichaceae archaeon]
MDNLDQPRTNAVTILFISPKTSSFIESDVDMLKDYFNVKVINFTFNIKKIKISLCSITNLLTNIGSSDVLYTWFGDIHSFLAICICKLFRKKSFIVIGGYEVANNPEINYGLMSKSLTKIMVKFILDNADCIIAISKFIRDEIIKYSENKKIYLIYNGVDHERFCPYGIKENIVMTVANNISSDTIKLKGIDTFIKSAKNFSNIKFILIGDYNIQDVRDCIGFDIPSNVEFIGFVPNKSLEKWYQRAKIYCQLSLRESFGMALVEAMSCQCIPVVTNKAALPEIVGKTGYCAKYNDIESVTDAIREALDSKKGDDARERVISLFSKDIRREKLKNVILMMLRK